MFYTFFVGQIAIKINYNTYKFHRLSRRNFSGQNVLIPPDQNESILFMNKYIYWEYRNSLGERLCMKTCYNLKIFVNFIDFSCVIFWSQNVLIPQGQNLSIPFEKNMLILLVSNIYNVDI